MENCVLFAQVETEMDVPLELDRPLVEATTPATITISFFAPRATLPSMRIRSFIVQVYNGSARRGRAVEICECVISISSCLCVCTVGAPLRMSLDC